MAETVEVGKLVVTLIADAKQLEGALSQGTTSLKQFDTQQKQAMSNASRSADAAGAAMGRLVGRIAGMVAAYVSVNAAVQAFNNAIENVSALDQLSQITGASVERLSELRNIALATGVDFQTLSQVFTQFGARMTEALASPVSKGSQAIRALGVDVRDASGNLRQFDELLPELVDKFSQYANGTNKAALAAALFGEEAGPKLIPLLNRGRDALEEIRRKLGSTYTSEDAQRVREFQSVMAGMQVVFEKVVISIARMVDSLMRSREITPGATDAVERLTDAITRQESRVLSLNDAIESSIRLRGRAAQGDRDALAAAEKQLEELKNQLAAEQALQSMRESRYNQGAAQLKQAPAMDPFALEKAQLALQALQERLLGTRDIFDEINFSWQAHADVVTAALQKIDAANDQGFRREAARQSLMRQMRLAEQQGMLQVGDTAAQVITQIWPKNKGAAIASAIINTAVGITRALATLPPPWSWAQAALIAAAGAAQIATIRSTNENGTGGTASAPTAPAAPTEAAPSRSVSISGLDPGQLFGGGQVRGLIDLINEEVRNGATLISTRNLPT